MVWNEAVVGNDCVLTLKSGTAPDFEYTPDGSAPIPWHDPNVTKLVVQQHAGTPEDPKVKALDGFGLFDGYNLPNLKTADVTGLDVSQATNFNAMFWDHTNPLTITGLDTWDTSNALDMRGMFDYSSGITELDLSKWDTSKVAQMNTMFRDCSNLKTIGNPGLDIPTTANTTDMFAGATSLPCKTKTGRHHWTLNGNTLNWDEHTEGTECILTLDSGTGPDFGYTPDSSEPIPWRDPNITKLTIRQHTGTPEDPKVKALDGFGLFDGVNLPNLKTADVTGLDVSQATNFNAMFWDHTNPLTITGLDTWDTSNALDMNGVFDGSSGITELDLSKWNTSKVTQMDVMFHNCSNLKTIGNPGLDIPETATKVNTFTGATSLPCKEKTGRHHWTLSGNTLNWDEHTEGTECTLTLESGTAPDFGYQGDGTGTIPWNDANITKLTVQQHAGTSEDPKVKALDGYGLFDGVNLPNLKTADVTGLDVSQATNLSAVFWNHTNPLTITGLDTWDTSKAQTMLGMFNGSSGITQLDISGWNTENVTDMTLMFQNCSKLAALNLNSWNTSKVTDMTDMFKGASLLKTIGTLGVDIPAASTQTDMYKDSGLVCHKAGRHHWAKDGNVLDWQETPNEGLTECTLTLTKGTAPDFAYQGDGTGTIPWDDTSVTKLVVQQHAGTSEDPKVKALDGYGLFDGPNLPNLTSADVTGLDVNQATILSAVFWGHSKPLTITGLNTWDTSKAQDMFALFKDCTGITQLDLTGWDTHNVTNMKQLFYNCPSLNKIEGMGSWNTSAATDMSLMFAGDTNLTALDLIGWDTTKAAGSMDGLLPANLQALRLGKKTKLANATNNKAFANVANNNWADKSGITSTAWRGNTSDLAARAATANPMGEYVVSSFGYTFPTACTQPGSHTWDTLTWSETLEGEGENAECVLSLDSGTVPNHSAGSTTADTKVPWVNDNVTSAIVTPGVSLASSGGRLLFAKLPKVKSIDVTNLITTGDTDMMGMFYQTPNLKTLTGTENLDTSSVLNMQGMFNATNLAEINVSNWDTHNVTDMGGMFFKCQQLTQITGISDWDTSSVRHMGAMFSSDYKLTSLDLNNWNTASAANASAVSAMLPVHLQALRLGKKTKLDTAAFSAVSQPGTWVDKSGSHNDPWTLNPAWSGTTSELATRASTTPLGEYVVSDVTYSFPTACTQPGSHTWDTGTGNTLTWSETLTGEGENAECVLSLDSGTVPENSTGTSTTTGVPWSDDSVTKATVKDGVKLAPNTSETTYAGGAFLFGRLPRVKTIDVTNLVTAGNTSMQGMFWEDPALTSITGLKGFDTSKVTNMNSTFNVTSLASLDVSDWHTSNVTDMNGIFGNNPNLSTITGIDKWDTDKWDTEKVTDMGNMFANDTSLTTLDLNSWDTAKATGSMNGMLPPNLKALRLGKKTTLSNTTNNKAFANVNQSGTWADKSGMSSPAWGGNTAALATRAATADPAGAYIISTFNYTFPPLPLTALPFTGLTRRQILRGLLILAAGVLALVLAAAVHRARDRRADNH